jgi:predicted O-linked N-acetylglucosamine transferase (SPINDLY family)
MNVNLEQAKALVDEENYQSAVEVLDSCQEQDITQDYYWLYGIALFGQGLVEEAQDIWLEGLLTQSYTEESTGSLIQFLENYAKRQSTKPPSLTITTIYQLSEIVDNIDHDYYVDHYSENFLTSYLDIARKEALSLVINNKKDEARKIYETLSLFLPDDAEIFRQMATLCFHTEEYSRALELQLRAISLEPDKGIYYYELGVMFEKNEDYQQAINAYLCALEKDKTYADTYANLGNILAKLNQFEEAENIYQQAIDNEVNHFGVFINYGNLLLSQDKALEAVDIYKKAVPLFYQYPDVYHNLAIALEKIGNVSEAEANRGRALYYEGKYDEAFEIFEKCRSLYFMDNWDYWNEISHYYVITKKHDILLEKSMLGVKQFPDSVRQRFYVIYSLKCLLREHEAREFAYTCVEYFKNQPARRFIFLLLHQSIIPAIYHSQKEIELVRQRYSNELEDLCKQNVSDFLSETEKSYMFFALSNRNSHYLHFHAHNNLNNQKMYGQLVNSIIRFYFPELNQIPQLTSLANRKIRLGYVCFRSHILGVLFLEWIKRINRNQFEVFFYDMGGGINPKSEQFDIFSDHYYRCSWDFEKVAELIRQDQLDILVFLDTVIEPRLHSLSCFRLAPVQCATWGHPVTTGSPEIDYFLGSDAMEPANAQEHYSERLIRLPNLGIYQRPITIPELVISRSEFNLSEEEVVYISCQMLSKYLPRYDYLYPEIVKKVPNAKIVFFNAYESNSVTDIFKKRLSQVFNENELKLEDHCIFTPLLQYSKYLNLLKLSDVFLDTIGWSGCITTLDAISCELPIVTMPGELMRGRQSYGMLKIMGIEDMIAYTEADYIQLAVKLGNDQQFRQQMRREICQNSHKLYYDTSCIEALEQFYLDVLNKNN